MKQYRLLWDNLPIWHRTRWLSEAFAAHRACLVADTYTSAWCGTTKYIDPDDFFGSMARAYSRVYVNLGVDQMIDIVLGMLEKYHAHGFVLHSNRSCKPYSFGQHDIRKAVEKKVGIPCLMLEADMVDPRMFSEAQVQTRIDAYMEVLEQRG